MTAKQLKALAPLIPQSEAELTLRINDIITAQTTREEAVALRDSKIADARRAIEDKYEFDKLITTCDRDIDHNLAVLELWADKNRARFGDKKSITLAGVRLGWQGDGWKTALMAKVTWPKAVDFLNELTLRAAKPEASATARVMGAIAERFLRRKIEPNKDAMIEAREDVAAMETLMAAGVMVVTTDTFFVRREGKGQDEATLKAA